MAFTERFDGQEKGDRRNRSDFFSCVRVVVVTNCSDSAAGVPTLQSSPPFPSFFEVARGSLLLLAVAAVSFLRLCRSVLMSVSQCSLVCVTAHDSMTARSSLHVLYDLKADTTSRRMELVRVFPNSIASCARIQSFNNSIRHQPHTVEKGIQHDDDDDDENRSCRSSGRIGRRLYQPGPTPHCHCHDHLASRVQGMLRRRKRSSWNARFQLYGHY